MSAPISTAPVAASKAEAKASVSATNVSGSEYSAIAYSVSGRVATITLNRPDRLNAIVPALPPELRDAVTRANADADVRVIVVQGAGRAFCSGYDLIEFAEPKAGTTMAVQRMPWDPYADYANMKHWTDCYMSLFHSLKPTIAKVHGFAVAGGSDIALCCDMVVMSESARIGYPPARVWGSPTTAMWVFRVGAEKAKRMLFTGDLITGSEAERMGLILKAVPAAQLDSTVHELCTRISTVPTNQLFFQKMVIHNAVEPMLNSTQRLATFIDGCTRHSPEGVGFVARANAVGFQRAVRERDAGTFDFNIFTQNTKTDTGAGAATDTGSADAVAAGAGQYATDNFNRSIRSKL